MKKIIISLSLLSGFAAFAQEKPKTDDTKTTDIKEVTITKKVIQKKSDRLVYDVANSPVAKGDTTFDLLKETPLLSSIDDKSIKIAGKNNVVIYINNKKTTMNADTLEGFLKNTPAENISKIEVITLPGSEFNVESSDGIINIILKKKMDDGVNGNLRFNNTQAKENSQSSSGSINVRKGKFGANANLSYSDNIRNQEYSLINGNDQYTYASEGTVDNEDRNLGGYLNMDYELTEKQNIGLSYNFWASKTPNAKTDFFNTINSSSYTSSQNQGNSKDANHSANLNYEIKFDDEGSRLNLNVAYLNFHKDEFNSNITNDVTSNNSIIAQNSGFNQSAPQKIDNYSATADYTKVFKSFKLGAGGNFNKTKTDNDTYFENWVSGTGNYVKDENQSNHFVYDEKIGGVYVNLEKSFSDKFSGKIGTRLEFTDSFGEVLGSDITVSRNNVNVLPTLSLNYNPNENNMWSYAFTSRVRRPSFWEINPVRIYLTEVNYIQNNPFMKSSSVYNQELMYMYKSAYFIQIQNTYTKDAITQVPLQKVVNGVNTIRYIRTNYGTENNFSANLGFNKGFFKQIWTANVVVGLQVNTFKGSVDTDPITNEVLDPFVFDYTRATPFFQANNNIRLAKNKTWFLGVNYFYLGKSRQDLGTLDPIQQLDFSLKKIYNNWTFSANLYDAFNTNITDIYDLQSNGNFNKIHQYSYNRRGSVSITYNFGNQKVKKVRSVEGAADDIKQRTGN